MREMKNKNPSFHIEKEGFYVQVMHPYINEVPHSIFQAIKLAGSGTVFKNEPAAEVSKGQSLHLS